MQILGLLRPVCKHIHRRLPTYWAHGFLTFLQPQWEGCVCCLQDGKRHAPLERKGQGLWCLLEARQLVLGPTDS